MSSLEDPFSDVHADRSLCRPKEFVKASAYPDEDESTIGKMPPSDPEGED